MKIGRASSVVEERWFFGTAKYSQFVLRVFDFDFVGNMVGVVVGVLVAMELICLLEYSRLVTSDRVPKVERQIGMM